MLLFIFLYCHTLHMNIDNILLVCSPSLRSSNSNSEEICGTLQAAEWT